MRKKIFAGLLSIITMISCTHQEVKNWTRFSSPEGGFAVLMPGQPLLDTGGDKSKHSYSVRTKEADYYIEYYDDSKLSAEQMMDIPRSAVMTGQNIKLLSDRKIDFNGHPGRELKFDVHGGEMLHLIRIYVVGNRAYTMMVVTAPADREASAEAEKFFSSFELI